MKRSLSWWKRAFPGVFTPPKSIEAMEPIMDSVATEPVGPFPATAAAIEGASYQREMCADFRNGGHMTVWRCVEYPALSYLDRNGSRDHYVGGVFAPAATPTQIAAMVNQFYAATGGMTS